MKSHIKFLIGSLSLLVFASCGSEKETDKIGDAQICLNKATDLASSNACLTKIEGIESTAAYGVRCNGSFIAEGFASPTKYITALSSLNGAGGTAGFMGLVTFTSAGTFSTDLSNASTTFTNCLNSGAKGTTLLSSFGYLAMAIYNYAKTTGNAATQTACANTPSSGSYPFSGCLNEFFNPINILGSNQTAISQMLCPTSAANASAMTLQTSIGSIIVSTYNISCAGAGANQSLCATLNTTITNAGGTSNTRTIAISFFSTLAGVDLSAVPSCL
ncbi:MAG: hypothetical protein AABY64_05170 [Bdellovibrionota bacterium]